MSHQVNVRLAPPDDIVLKVAQPLSSQEARTWLDQEYVRLGCTPTRATGKVLFSDRVLAIAEAAGTQGFADAQWAQRFAAAAAGALGKTFIRVDVPEATVGY